MAKRSSVIDSVQYDGTTKTLAVDFRNGSRYHYTGVERSTLSLLLNAPSVGQAFNREVREQFPTKRIR